ncbi:hypothetical protein FHEFKHOI_00200 [Candidatus Methanoperedenaceae archaeon GB50]|nr:hypothetical protein FHEFKHOI_00200 [Candidatus Methanoperedenaceae archaeon GB50]CAD7774478.1 MAG: hypothetical protein KBONHNOK_00718 [Candidatus Methanoperedenaceae archaeon GB50]
MLRVREIVKELKVFERNKVPFDVKVLGIATYIQTSSLGRTARVLSLASSGPYRPLFGTGNHRVKIFFCSITSFNPVKNWNLFCKLFMLYYNRLRWCLC